MKKGNKLSRRTFLKSSALAGTIGMIGSGSTSFLSSCSNNTSNKATVLKEPGSYYIPELPDMAIDGKELRAGVIGCGGRGSGATFDFLDSANGVTIVALADMFEDKVDALANRLKKEKNVDVPKEKRFVGLDAYKQLVDSSDVDVVIDCTPSFFRPTHFEYIIKQGKHCFIEKPLFVDAVGYRKVMATAKQATAKKLTVITGTIRHHQRSYVESYKKIMDGAIGEITGGAVYYNGGAQWARERQPGWTDLEYMIKDWSNWRWLSGDMIIEQHIHSIDAFIWLTGLKPVSALSFGSSQRRTSGDRYDNFSTDFRMENGVHMHSMCRQIDGCTNNVSNYIQGTKGSWHGFGAVGGDVMIKDLYGNVIWQFDEEKEKSEHKQTNPFVLEHVNLVNCIRKNKPIEQASEAAVSNMAAMMGRESAYSGLLVMWKDLTTSSLDYTPADLNMEGNMDMSSFVTPVPGKSQK